MNGIHCKGKNTRPASHKWPGRDNKYKDIDKTRTRRTREKARHREGREAPHG